MTDVIRHTVNSPPPKSLLRLRDYLGSFGLGASEALVDIFHVNLHHKPRRCHHLVLQPSRTRRRYIEQTVPDLDPGTTTTWPCQSRLCTSAKAKYALKSFDSMGDTTIDDRGNYIWRITHFLICHLLLRSLIGHLDASRKQVSFW
jgi:hypothetical protein